VSSTTNLGAWQVAYLDRGTFSILLRSDDWNDIILESARESRQRVKYAGLFERRFFEWLPRFAVGGKIALDFFSNSLSWRAM